MLPDTEHAQTPSDQQREQQIASCEKNMCDSEMIMMRSQFHTALDRPSRHTPRLRKQVQRQQANAVISKPSVVPGDLHWSPMSYALPQSADEAETSALVLLMLQTPSGLCAPTQCAEPLCPATTKE